MQILLFFSLIFPIISLFCVEKVNACTAPIARVISQGHPHYKVGDPLCARSTPKLSNTVPLKVVCLFSQKAIVIRQSSDYQQCPARNEVSPNFPRRPNFVVRNGAAIFKIESPLGMVIRESSVTLQWTPVKGAQVYEITVDAAGRRGWKNIISKKNSVLLDKLTAGQSYYIAVRAKGNTEIGRTTLTLEVLSEEHQRKITQGLIAIDQSQIPTEDKLFMKLGLLSQYNLTHESISLATQYLFQNPKNLHFARALGDLYASSFLPTNAVRYYNQYLVIAQQMKNQNYVLDAQQRIRYIVSAMQNSL
jgi:hypothetical protein